MTLSNCDSLDNLFQDPPEEEESSKFVEAVRTLMNRNDMGYPPAAANGTYCLKKNQVFECQTVENKQEKNVHVASSKEEKFRLSRAKKFNLEFKFMEIHQVYQL